MESPGRCWFWWIVWRYDYEGNRLKSAQKTVHPSAELKPKQKAGRHRQPDCPRLPLAALAEPGMILLRKGNNLYERAWEMFEAAGITPRVKMDLNQLVTAYHLAEAGMAATLVSGRIVKPGSDTLRYYPLDTPLATRIFYILLPQNAYVPVAVRRFVDHALTWMGKAPAFDGKTA